MSEAPATLDDGGIIAFVERFAQEIGLPTDVFQQIILDDDWVAVIKASAVIETILNDTLAPAVPAEWRAWFIRRVTVSTKRELALKRERLDPFTAKAVEALFTLRNSVVHDARGFSFTFAEYLNTPTGADFIQRLAPTWVRYDERGSRRPTDEEISQITRNPKMACMMVALMASLELQGRLPADTLPRAEA